MKLDARFLFHALCPNRCACCSKVIFPDQSLCFDCAQSLPWIPDDICPSCGYPKKKCICSCKRRTLFPCLSPFFYEGNVKAGLLTLKRGTTAHGVRFFSQAMARMVTTHFGHSFDGIAYAPMTKDKIRIRGYNQSRLLAKSMGKILGLPVLDNALVRLYDTDEQHQSPLNQRKGNVFGVFEANPKIVDGKHLLLVDDIITTGATLEECGKMLLLAGCEEVCGITVASTKYNKKEDETI